MPEQIFFNLREEKSKKIRDAFLREFAIQSFDDASITKTVKTLGIAKGSIYQYFKDKQDLFLYLVEECSKVKMRYIGQLKQEDYPDFWQYFRDLYVNGFKFDAENPLESHFLHNLANNLNSPSIQALYDHFLNETVRAFEKMVKFEIKRGHFRSDLPVKTLAFFLYKSGLAINDQIVVCLGLDLEQIITKGEPVYLRRQKDAMKVVDEYIEILKGALNKKS